MLPYTICFMKQSDNVLLLNREKPSWMGMWNGIGGKLEPYESPRQSILREIAEETGIVLSPDTIRFKGLITWSVDGNRVGGMYAYMAELPSDSRLKTPIKTDEGILDWKEIHWILSPENQGVAYYIPKCIENILFDPDCYEYRCWYKDGRLIRFETGKTDEDMENIRDRKVIEERVFRHYFRENAISGNRI